MPARWTIFCSMIDNFGDIGVCWRLARQLADEHGIAVDLWVDDWPALQRFMQAQCVDPDSTQNGVSLLHWLQPWSDSSSQRVAACDLVIEAFGCELPEPVKQQLAQRQIPLLWINLEYLSAEAWVKGCHGLTSPQNLSPLLKKYFFFPGFEPGTGGLLREQGLTDQHVHWQADLQACRRQVLDDFGLQAILPADYQLMISVFSYETPALPGWFAGLAKTDEAVLCLVPEGRSLASVAAFFGVPGMVAGDVLVDGALTVAVVPFCSQSDYDRLLSVCDFNLVRGEDSFVRAQWAARPFMWHIYPQDDGVHIHKLQAFADLYLKDASPESRQAWQQLALGWNLGEDCADLWHYLRPQLPDLQQHARRWQQTLADMPDLATNLVNFDTFTTLSAHP